jgi:hypothetical protein
VTSDTVAITGLALAFPEFDGFFFAIAGFAQFVSNQPA